VIRTMPDGKNVAVLLVDTQGTFDNHMRQEMNAVIFALNSLLSSMQVYNVSKRVGEDVLQNMHMFTKFGQMAYEQQSSDDTRKIKPFQRLQFLVRDWGGKRDHPFGVDGGAAYLETVLNSQDGEQELLDVRRDIKSCFETIDCFLMPYPGDEVAEGESAEVTERFREHLAAFVPSMLSAENLVVKQVLGEELTCSSLRTYIKSYVALFKDGSLPEVTNIFNATAKLNHEGIKRQCIDAYKASMNEFAGVDKPFREREKLDEKHKEEYEKAIESYQQSPRLEHPRVEQESLADMEKIVREFFTEMSTQNESKILFNRLVTPITLFAIAFVANVLGTFISIIGIFSFIGVILSYVTWICLLAVAFWAYSQSTHEYADVTKELDKICAQVSQMALSLYAEHVKGQIAASMKKTE